MNTVNIAVSTIPTVDAYLEKYLKDRIGDQKGFKLLKSSGDYEKPDEKEQLILLSFCQNGTHQKFVDETFLKSGTNRTTDITVEFKKYSVVIEKNVQQTPTVPEDKKIVPAIKKDSKEKKMLVKAMRAQIYSMLGNTESKKKSLEDAVNDHFAKNIKGTAKIIIAAYDEDDELTDESRNTAMDYSIISTFEKLLGPIPVAKGKEAVVPSEEVAALGKLFSLKYQKMLLVELEVKDANIADVFKNKVLDSTAKNLSLLTDDSIEESRATLEPEYEDALEDLKIEIFPGE